MSHRQCSAYTGSMTHVRYKDRCRHSHSYAIRSDGSSMEACDITISLSTPMIFAAKPKRKPIDARFGNREGCLLLCAVLHNVDMKFMSDS